MKLNYKVLEALGFEQKTDQKQPPEIFCKKREFLKFSPISQWKETGEAQVLHTCFSVKLMKFLWNFVWKTSAKDCLWQMISSMVYFVLYNTKNIFQIFVSLVYCRFSYAGNWELVKSIVGTKFRRSHVCLHSQAGNRLW